VAIKAIFCSVAFGYLEYLSARQRSTQTVSPQRRLGFKAYAFYAAPARILRRGMKVRFRD
jgi:hypothetical protein